jgi:prevent-host-death family protein
VYTFIKMIDQIVNFREFRKKLAEYINKAMEGRSIIIKSKNREVVILSLEEYRDLTGDETAYLLSSKANKKHLLQGIDQVQKGETKKFSLDELLD